MASSFERYRRAGATARAMLSAAAAQEWNVPVGEITVAKGALTHASGKTATFGELAVKAAALPVPADLPLKDASQWTFIGNETLPRYDSLPKSTGKQDYTLDVKLPGMLTAVMIHPPLFGSVVKSFDASKAKAVKGVVDVVETPRGLAVVADNSGRAEGPGCHRRMGRVEGGEARLRRALAEYRNQARSLAPPRPATTAMWMPPWARRRKSSRRPMSSPASPTPRWSR
jgi:isoquinoline 1-oxidoreductase beta subunit